MAETGFGNGGKVNGGGLQTNEEGRSGVCLGSGLFQLFWADNAPRVQGLAGGTPEYLERETILGAVSKFAKAEGSGPNHIGKVLLCGVSDVDTI